MTDEELADKSWLNRGLWYCVHTHESSYKNGFLAGLNEGRPKWHDLRKDPNDLPKTVKDYITNIGVMTFSRLKDRHLWTTPVCDACDYFEEVTDEVIAWCEEPKFEEG